MRFIEATETAWSAEQLAAAEREIEEQKREWEENRLAAMREEEKRRAREMEEEADLLTYTREDATNQVSKVTKKVTKKVLVKKVKVVAKPKAENDVKNKGKARISNRISKRNKEIVEPDSTTQTSVSDNEPAKVNGDDCSISCESEIDVNNASDTDSDSIPLAKRICNVSSSNHIDHNSPRTRSHGTVAINLWTLDVSPILPGVKPVVKNSATSSAIKTRNSSSEKEIDVEKKVNSKTVRKKLGDALAKKKSRGKTVSESNDSVSSSENDEKERQKVVSMCKEKVCKVVVQDVMTTEDASKYLPKNNNKNVDITKNLDKEAEVEIANADDDSFKSNKKRKNVKNCNNTVDNWLQKKDEVLSGNSIIRTSNKEPNED